MPGHHFDAGQRVLDLVRDRGGHLAERRQPIAQAFALLELLDARQVLEEQRRAGDLAVLVLDLRERVADHFARALQPQLGAVGQMRQDRTRRRRCAQTSGRSLRTWAKGRPMSVVLRRESQNPVGDVVHDGDAAVAGHREDPVPEIPDEIAVKAVRRGAAAGAGAGCAFERPLAAAWTARRRGSRGFSDRHSGCRPARTGSRLGRQYCNRPILASQGLLHE